MNTKNERIGFEFKLARTGHLITIFDEDVSAFHETNSQRTCILLNSGRDYIIQANYDLVRSLFCPRFEQKRSSMEEEA